MPRKPRKRSEVDIYHVIVRGVAKRIIFEDDEDRERFLKTLSRFSQEMDIAIYAWVLMDNHVHILIRVPFEELSLFVKKVLVSYVAFFNRKYDRCGHLFQGRFRSEAVDTERYFLTVLRYIHQNPVLGGMAKDCSFAWSSYDEYIVGRGVADISPLDMFGNREEFVAFHRQLMREDGCLKAFDLRKYISDSKAVELIRRHFGSNILTVLEQASRAKRDSLLFNIKNLGIPIRQLARLTGLSRRVVSLAKT